MLLSYYNRGECMDYMTELTAIAKTHGGIIETKIAAQRGHLQGDALISCAKKIKSIVL